MSLITLTIEADSAAELHKMVAEFTANPVPVLEKAVAEVMEKKEAPVVEKEVKKQKPFKEKKQEKVADSGEETSDTEPSKTGEDQELIEDNEPDKSVTVGKYPNATKADVQKAMKQVLADGKRNALTTAFERFYATKLSDLQPEDYSAFLTDLEVIAGD